MLGALAILITAGAIQGAELRDLVKPLLFYPDNEVAPILAASTYPLELVEAQAWLQANPGHSAGPRLHAAEKHHWEASIAWLLVFDYVLEDMNRNLVSTIALGDAFLERPADVMAAIQEGRREAFDHGELRTNTRTKVTPRQTTNGGIIEILQVKPPRAPASISGWTCDWERGEISTPSVQSYGSVLWHHSPYHRGPSPYASDLVAQRYSRSEISTRGSASRSVEPAYGGLTISDATWITAFGKSDGAIFTRAARDRGLQSIQRTDTGGRH